MPSFTSTLTLAGLLATALSSPISPAATNNVFRRATDCPANDNHYSSNDWCSKNKEDSVIVLASDNKVAYGDKNPGDIIGAVRGACSNGVCDDDVSLDSIWVGGQKNANAGKLKVNIATQVTDPVHLGPMLDSLQWTLDRLKDFEKKEWLEPGNCVTAMCSPIKHTAEQTTGPSGITIQVREKDSDKKLYDRPIVSSLTLTFEAEQNESGKGLCSAIGGVASAGLGAINGALGAVGAIAQLGCLAAP